MVLAQRVLLVRWPGRWLAPIAGVLCLAVVSGLASSDLGAQDQPSGETEQNPAAQTRRGFSALPCSLPEPVTIKSYVVKEGESIDEAVPEPLVTIDGDPETGAEIFAGAGLGDCLACHAVSALANRAVVDRPDPSSPDPVRRWGGQGTVGPSLDDVADRYTPGELRLILLDPARALSSPDTIKSSYHRAGGLTDVPSDCIGQPILSAEEIEHLIAFLRTLKK